MKKVFYLSFYYKNEPNKPQRKFSLAGVNKADYICQSLLDDGYDVELVSPNLALNGEFLPAENITYPSGLKQRLFTSLQAKTKMGRLFRRIFMQCSVFAYLICQLKHGSPLIVYHSLYYCRLVYLIKRITKCKLILQVEEIYSDVINASPQKRKKELEYFKCADAYIFPTELLAESINTNGKQQAIVHGNYLCTDCSERKLSVGLIHCVYAGSLDPRKGVLDAIAAARYLPENYRMHILGQGTELQMRNLLSNIEEVNKESSCAVAYDGVLTGESFSTFLHSCDIGLSTQNLNAPFNDTSFPSKTLTYLCHGLKVVSAKILAVERSAVAKELIFYGEQTPKAIADAILKVKFDEHSSIELIKQLDSKFKEELAQLIQ